MAPAAQNVLTALHDAGLRLLPDGDQLHVHPADLLNDGLRESIRHHKPALLALLAANDTDRDTLPDAGMERRRQAVLRMLSKHPEISRAEIADAEEDPVRIALGVRGVGSCELTVPASKWCPFQFLGLTEKHGEHSDSVPAVPSDGNQEHPT